MDVKIRSCFIRDVPAYKVWGVRGWMLNVVCVFCKGRRCFYGLGDLWVDVKCCVRFVRHVVASNVWGCVSGC